MGGSGITRVIPTTATMVAALAVAAMLVPIAIASVLTVPSDAMPPTFGDVAHCHIEQIASDAEATTVKCTMPVHTDNVTPANLLGRDVAIPPAMQGGKHTIEWSSADGVLKLTKSGIALADGTHKAKWTATDGANNVSTTEQVITVEDTQPPAFKPGIATSYEMEAQTVSTDLVARSFGIVATDSVGIKGVIRPSVDSVKVGAHTVTWTAEDDAGNTSTLTQSVTVKDTTDPVIDKCPTPHIMEATGNPTELKAKGAGVTATDKATADDDIRISPSRPSIALDASAPVRWTATDGAGRTATCAQLLSIRDRVAPEITPEASPGVLRPKTLFAEDSTVQITASAAGVDATDAVDPDPDLRPDVDELGVGVHTVRWTARDSSQNSSSKDQSITVERLKFAVTSIAFNTNTFDLTFSKNVNPATTDNILINKRGLIAKGKQDILGLIATTTTNGKVVSVAPSFTRPPPTYAYSSFCTPSRADPDVCVGGSIGGSWVISLPMTLLSTSGDSLYSGTASTLRICGGVDVPGAPVYRFVDSPGCLRYHHYPNDRPAGIENPRNGLYEVWSDTPSSTPTPSSTMLPPEPPLPLQMRAALPSSTDAISLAWSRSLPSATYAVEQSTDGSAFTTAQVAIPINSTRASISITAADLGSSLSYRIVETVDGAATRSDAVTVILPASLDAPSGLSAYRSASGTSIELEWRSAPIATGYHVERAASGGAFERIATVTQNSHTVDIASAAAGSHTFRVVTYLGGATSSPSSAVSVSVP